MVYVIGAFLVLLVVRHFVRALRRSDRASNSLLATQAAGSMALIAAGLLLSIGRFASAAGLALIGFWCLGYARRLPFFDGVWAWTSRAGTSRLRTAMIEMEVDHRSHNLAGRVLAGEFEGQRLDQLSEKQCRALHAAALFQDSSGARLLEAYLDRRFPGWRPARDGHRDARGGRERQARPGEGAMTENEAYDVLGLRQGAGRQDIVRAHRSLMKIWHPDHGGSTDVAARVNEAKDILLRLHAN